MMAILCHEVPRGRTTAQKENCRGNTAEAVGILRQNSIQFRDRLTLLSTFSKRYRRKKERPHAVQHEAARLSSKKLMFIKSKSNPPTPLDDITAPMPQTSRQSRCSGRALQ